MRLLQIPSSLLPIDFDSMRRHLPTSAYLHSTRTPHISDTFSSPAALVEFLDQPYVRETLGVDPATGSFSTCSDPVSDAFARAMDVYHASCAHVAQLLERGVRTLIYVGDYDWICNWIANERWTMGLEWSGRDGPGGGRSPSGRTTRTRRNADRKAPGAPLTPVLRLSDLHGGVLRSAFRRAPDAEQPPP